MCEKMMGNTIKNTHSAVAEGKEPYSLLKSFIREYCLKPQAATIKAFAELLLARNLRDKVPSIQLLNSHAMEMAKDIQKRDTEYKLKSKLYLDKKKRAYVKEIRKSRLQSLPQTLICM